MEKIQNLNINSNRSEKNKNYTYESEDDDNKSTELNEPQKENKQIKIAQTIKEGIFSNLNIFVEIFNNGVNQSDCVIPILEEYGAIIAKKISKSTNYIIFKDGRKKIIQKALDNEVKLINPLWVHDCTTKNTLIKPENYQIKKTYTELLLENRKRKYNDVVLNTTKSVETPGKKRKLDRKVDKKFISPFISDKENKVNSQPVKVRTGIKTLEKEQSDEELDVVHTIDKHNLSKVDRRHILEDTSDNINNISVFGKNIRCFNDGDLIKKESNFLNTSLSIPGMARDNNKENKSKPLITNSRVYGSSIKFRPNIPQFTPITDGKYQGRIKDNNIDENKPNMYSKSTVRSNINTLDMSNSINSKLYKSRNNSFANNINPSTNNLKLVTKSLNLNIDFNAGSNSTTNITSVRGNNIVNNIQAYNTNKILSKSTTRLNNNNININTTAKSGIRKMLLSINSPDSQDVENSERIAIETITKAINNENFAEVNNFNNNADKVIKTCLSSIGLNETSKVKVKAVVKELIKIKSPKSKSTSSVYSYTGENYFDLEESEYIIIKQTSTFNFFKEIKTLYVSLLNNRIIESEFDIERRFIRYNYFIESEKKKKFVMIENYVIKFSIDYEAIEKLKVEEKLPYKGYKIFLHPECYVKKEKTEAEIDEDPEDKIKHLVLLKLVTLLGGSNVYHIRLSDLCIINKIDSAQYFPPHVRNLNQDVIYDTLSTLKLPELDNFKYKPKDGKYKKNRK